MEENITNLRNDASACSLLRALSSHFNQFYLGDLQEGQSGKSTLQTANKNGAS